MELPFATGYYIDDSRPTAYVECTNAIPEIISVAGQQKAKLRAPSGVILFSTAGTNANRGAWVMDELMYEVGGNTLYRIDSDGTNTSLGTISGAGRVSMADNGTQLCIVVPGSVGYIYTVAGGLVQITDIDYTSNPSIQVSFADGYFLHVTETKFFISALNDGLTFDGLDFAAAETLPDKITSVHVSRNQVYIGGVETIEPFQNIGGAGFPYQRVNGGVIPIGIKAKFSLVEYARTFAFIGGGPNEIPSIYLYTGSVPERIATNAIDNILIDQTDAELKDIYCTAYSERGGVFLNVHFNDRTMTYDRATGLWHERTSKNSFGQQTNWRVTAIVTAYGKTMVTDNQSGRIGEMDDNVYTEYGDSVKRVFGTMPLTAEDRDISFSQMEIVMENGTGTTAAAVPAVPAVPGTGAWELVGEGLSLSVTNWVGLASLNSTDVAFIENGTQELRTYRFDGTNWAQVGNGLSITGSAFQGMVSLSATDIALFDNGTDNLSTYRFDGADWAQVGSSLSIPGNVVASLAALNGTDIAFIGNNLNELRTYRFDGSNWSQLGVALPVYSSGTSAISYPSVTALNSTDIAFTEGNSNEVRTYRFDGTNWAQIGNSLTGIGNIGYVSIASLNSEDIAFIDGNLDDLRVYRFDGADWAQVGSGLLVSGADRPKITALDNNNIAYIDSGTSELRTYRTDGTEEIPAIPGLPADQADENPQIQRSFSDDGGFTFSNETGRAIGKEGNYLARQVWFREGQTKRHRMYRFVHDSPTKFVVRGLRAVVQ